MVALLSVASDPARVSPVDAVDTAFVLGCKGGRLDLLLVGPCDGAPRLRGPSCCPRLATCDQYP
jgi:hypothetical protein